MVADAVLLKIALIVARGHKGLRADKAHDGDRARRVVRVGDADLPCRAVRLAADGLHIAAEREHGGLRPGLLQLMRALLCRISLGDAAEVNAAARIEGGRRAVQLQMLRAGVRERSGQLGLRRDMIFPGGEAPEADKGIDCRVKGSARARGAIQRLLQEVCGLWLQLRRAVPVQAGDVAVLCRGGKQGFERTERVLRLRDKGLIAPDAQAHQRVHGKKLCLVRLRLLWAAARQDQCCQKYGSEPFFQGDHLIFRDHYIKKEKFSQIVFDIFLPGWYDRQAASKRYKLEVCPHASRARLQKGRCKQTCRQLSLPVASSTASRRAT